MNKFKLVSVVAGLFSSTSVLADTTFFGEVQAAYGFQDDALKGSDHKVITRGSRIGVKGFAAIDEQNDVTYMIEEGDLSDETRQAWLGVHGTFGEFRAGRQLGATQVSSERVEVFENQFGDYNAILESEHSHDQTVTYINKFGDVGFAVEVSRDDELSSDGSDATVADFVVNYQKGAWYAAIAHLNVQDNFDTTRLTGVYTFLDGHQVGAVFEKNNNKQGDGHDAFVMSGRYQSGDLTFKAQFGYNEPEKGGENETLAAVGVDYKWNKSTTFTSEYAINQHRDHTAEDELKTFALGIIYQF
ncbi:MAG: hypothetical protein CR991_03970 [Proteobacteria bacterium]|nr:MAG: hypothetical protein CR991_03970 [Pseudomonadota bacterium]